VVISPASPSPLTALPSKLVPSLIGEYLCHGNHFDV
jgi:hypothetical protein